jgi:hypothetical protein
VASAIEEAERICPLPTEAISVGELSICEDSLRPKANSLVFRRRQSLGSRVAIKMVLLPRTEIAGRYWEVPTGLYELTGRRIVPDDDPYPPSQTISRRLAVVSQRHSERYWLSYLKLPHLRDRCRDICPELLPGGVGRDFYRLVGGEGSATGSSGGQGGEDESGHERRGLEAAQPQPTQTDLIGPLSERLGLSGYAVAFADAFNRAPLGAQIGVFAVLGLSAVGSIATGLARVLEAKRPRWIGGGLIAIGATIWIGAYLAALWSV